MDTTTQVIAVTGPPGGGKSTLVGALAENLSAGTLFYDDFEQITRGAPEAILAALRAGGDFSDIEIPGLEAALGAGKASAEHRWLVLETQLGRAHTPTGAYIDHQVWIDTPLDIALARNMRKFTESFLSQPAHAQKQLKWQLQYLESYLDTVRETLCIQKERILEAADLVIDGTLSPADQLQVVLVYLQAEKL